jgi:HK97 family phage major capsid protein
LTRGVDSASTSVPNNPGIVNIAQTAVTTTELINGVSFNNLWDIFEALDVSFLPRAVWMMTSQMRNVLAKSQDSTGRSLLVPSPTIAGVDMLLQKPIVINNSLDLPGTANGVPIVFGSLFDGVEMVSSEVGVQNLTERYSDQLLNALIVTTRVGSTALAPGALQKLVLAAS